MGVAPLTRLLGLAWLRALLLTQLGGAGLLALVVATESASTGGNVLHRLLSDVPHTWALLSPSLALVGAALAVDALRRRGDWLTLATLGVRRVHVLLSVLAVAIPLGAFAAVVEGLTAPVVGMVRVPGGWLAEGLLLDPGAVAPAAEVLAEARWTGAWQWPGTALLGIAGSLAGAALGARARGGAVLVAACVWLVVDLLRRGSSAEGAVAWAAVLCGAAVAAVVWALRGREELGGG